MPLGGEGVERKKAQRVIRADSAADSIHPGCLTFAAEVQMLPRAKSSLREGKKVTHV